MWRIHFWAFELASVWQKLSLSTWDGNLLWERQRHGLMRDENYFWKTWIKPCKIESCNCTKRSKKAKKERFPHWLHIHSPVLSLYFLVQPNQSAVIVSVAQAAAPLPALAVAQRTCCLAVCPVHAHGPSATTDADSPDTHSQPAFFFFFFLFSTKEKGKHFSGLRQN